MAIEVPAIFAYLASSGASPDQLVSDGGTGSLSENAAFTGIGFIALILGLVPAFYVTLRLSLALPATATAERRGSFGHSWRASAGNGWRMVGATLLAMLPVEFFNLGIGFFARANAGEALHYPLVLIAAVGMLYLMAVMGTVLSRCYAFAESAVPHEEPATIQMTVPG